MFGALLTRLKPTSAIQRDGESLLLSRTEFNREVARERIRATRRMIPFCVVSMKLHEEKQRRQKRRALIRLLHRNVRLTDQKADLGRSQFGILLVDTPESGGRAVVDRLMGLCESQHLNVEFALRVHDFDDPPESPEGHLPAGGGRRAEDFGDGQTWTRVDDGTDSGVYSSASDNDVLTATGPSSLSANGTAVALAPPNDRTVAGLRDKARLASSRTVELNRLDGPLRVESLDEFGLLQESTAAMRWSQRAIKRGIDLCGAGVGMFFALPVLAACAAAIKWTSPGPVFFRQKREGRGGKPFTIYKLRTMVVDAEDKQCELREQSHRDGPAFKIKHDPRVTRVGNFLRKTCLDELPQLINVLKGDMSIVGPRPLPWDESRACDAWHRRRLDIKPGMTCHWQVNKAAAETFDDWMRMDLRYVDHHGVGQDVKLMARTLLVPLSGRGSE